MISNYYYGQFVDFYGRPPICDSELASFILFKWGVRNEI